MKFINQNSNTQGPIKSEQNILKENINVIGNQVYRPQTISTPQFNQINPHPGYYNANKATVPPVLNVQNNSKNLQYQPGNTINRNMNVSFGSGYVV